MNSRRGLSINLLIVNLSEKNYITIKGGIILKKIILYVFKLRLLSECSIYVCYTFVVKNLAAICFFLLFSIYSIFPKVIFIDKILFLIQKNMDNFKDPIFTFFLNQRRQIKKSKR